MNTTTQFSSHADQMAMLDTATKQAYWDYSNLAWLVINQLQHELGGNLGIHAKSVKSVCGLPLLNKTEIANHGYRAFSYNKIQDAYSALWDNFGKTGHFCPRLIERANARRKSEKVISEGIALAQQN